MQQIDKVRVVFYLLYNFCLLIFQNKEKFGSHFQPPQVHFKFIFKK